MIPPLPLIPTRHPRCGDLRLWEDCWRGMCPAEALPTRDREDLVYRLAESGWTDVEIATHTRMTLYTTQRIRARLGIAPQAAEEEAAA